MLKIFEEHGRKNSNNTYYQFWQQNNQPKELFQDVNSFMFQKLDYIHNNPMVAGIDDRDINYIYSSAKDYAGIKGILDVDLLL